MIMEYMEGGSLAQVVSKWNLTESQICFVTREVCLSYLLLQNSRKVLTMFDFKYYPDSKRIEEYARK